MKKIYIYTNLIIILICNNLFSQSDCDLHLRENFFNEEIIGYYLTAIDIESGESNILLFDYELEVNGENCSFPDDIKISFSVSIDIPNYTDGSIEITSGLFTLDFTETSDDLSSVSFRNTDLSLNTQFLPGGVLMNMNSNDYNVNISSDEIDDLSSLILGLGRIPNGRYNFNFSIVDCPSDFECSISGLPKVIDVFVPTYLNLVSPGSVDISDSLSTEVFIPYPVFQWSADYCNKCTNYSIRICEYNPDIHHSLEDAINSVSVLPINSSFYDIGSLNNSFQYPVSGVESLVPGTFYVWQVKRSYETTYGTHDDLSDIFIFKMKDFEHTQNVPISIDQDKLNFIQSIIGETKFNELFVNDDSPFYNYNNTDSNVKINGELKSFEYIIELLNNSNIQIIEVDYE